MSSASPVASRFGPCRTNPCPRSTPGRPVSCSRACRRPVGLYPGDVRRAVLGRAVRNGARRVPRGRTSDPRLDSGCGTRNSGPAASYFAPVELDRACAPPCGGPAVPAARPSGSSTRRSSCSAIRLDAAAERLAAAYDRRDRLELIQRTPSAVRVPRELRRPGGGPSSQPVSRARLSDSSRRASASRIAPALVRVDVDRRVAGDFRAGSTRSRSRTASRRPGPRVRVARSPRRATGRRRPPPRGRGRASSSSGTRRRAARTRSRASRARRERSASTSHPRGPDERQLRRRARIAAGRSAKASMHANEVLARLERSGR